MKKKKKHARARKKKPSLLLPFLAGLAVVCALVMGAVWIWGEFSTEPEETLPPNLYSAGDFTRDDRGWLTCTAGEAVTGIDVSDHQGPIDWQAVADAGVEFAFIRLGYRGNTQGIIYTDERAEENLAGAKAAGLKIGAYFYSQAVDTAEAEQEAAFCLAFLGAQELDLPLVYDWEYVSPDARTGAMDRDTLTACAQVFCRAVEAEGYEAMVYANPDIAANFLNVEELGAYKFWLAQYADTMTYPYRPDFWQYTDKGTVPGIEGNVDMDLMFLYN